MNTLKTISYVTCISAAIFLSACDTTVFGDSEPDLDNPFTEGSSLTVSDPALASPLSLIASQEWPGIFYALADEDQATLHAFDKSGHSQGSLSLEGISRGDWKDLALNNSSILILEGGAGQTTIHSFAEPSTPPPFSGSLAVQSSQNVLFADIALPNCDALGAANEASSVTLLCNSRFYTFDLSNSLGGLGLTTSAGNLAAEISALDFSISPGGEFAVVTTANQLLIVQSDSGAWAEAFSGNPATRDYNLEDFSPQASAYAFNGILLNTLGTDTQDTLLFSVFNP